ncbi:MAG: helix-turn-helix domain-containing protein [Acidobacteriota bacterium]
MKKAASDDDRVWRALAEPLRRRILDALAEAPCTTGQLVELLPEIGRTAVMKHLDVLEAAELIIVERVGRVRWNHFNAVPIDRICRHWIDKRRQRITGQLDRLKNLAEADAQAELRRDKE